MNGRFPKPCCPEMNAWIERDVLHMGLADEYPYVKAEIPRSESVMCGIKFKYCPNCGNPIEKQNNPLIQSEEE